MNLRELISRILNGDHTDHEKLIAIRVLCKETVKVSNTNTRVDKVVEAIVKRINDNENPIPAPYPLSFDEIQALQDTFSEIGVYLDYLTDSKYGVFYVNVR
jgi:hypothetical protein